MTGLSPIVKLDGSSLASDWQLALLEVRVDLQFQVPARVTMRFTDPGYRLLQSSRIQLGTAVEVLAPGSDPKTLGSAEVTAVTCEQRPGEHPELVVEALDKGHRLGRATSIKVFQDSTYSDIVEELATDAGLVPETDSTSGRIDYLMQAESPLALITEAARRTGYDWWVEGEKLNFKRPVSQGEVELTLGKEIRSFSARVSGLQPSKVVVDGWDRSKQELVTASKTEGTGPKADSSFARLAGKATSAFGSATVVTGALGATEVWEAESLAQSVLDRALASTVTAKGLAEGDGRIKLGVTVKVAGAGPMSGSYPVTGIEHLYRPSTGFVTRFTSGERRPTTLVDSLAGGPGLGAYGGPAHLRSGVTVGKVTSNNDQEKKGRVRVRYPGVSSDAESGWARVVTVGGGKERGAVWIPEVDDEVLVGFEGGDARRPVIIGGLFGESSTIPETPILNGKVQSRTLASRLGHVVALLDGTTPDKQAIDLVLAGKKTAVHIGKDKVTIKAPTGVPIEVSSGSTSIKLTDSGDVKVNGVNVSIQASTKLSLKAPVIQVSADTELQMSGKATLGMSGALVKVSADAELKLAGAMVMIN